jgi:hypothetical protein
MKKNKMSTFLIIITTLLKLISIECLDDRYERKLSLTLSLKLVKTNF